MHRRFCALALSLALIPASAMAAKNTQTDAELLARLLYAEARGESREGMLMVAQCALDRLEEGSWGNTLRKVIEYPGQFASPGRLEEECLEVAQAALDGERFSEDHVILYFQRTTSRDDWYSPWLGREGKHAYYGVMRG